MGIDPKILSVIGALNTAALDATAWDEALAQFGTLFDAKAVAFELFDLKQGTARAYGYSGFPDDGIADYMAYYHHINPRIPYVAAMPTQKVVTDDAMIPTATRSSCEFLNWLSTSTDCLYCMGVKLQHDPNNIAVLAVHRTDPRLEFVRDDIRLLEQLSPYLQLINATAREIERLRGDRALDRALFDRMNSGIAHLDRSGRVTDTNIEMATILECRGMLSLNAGGRLLATKRMTQAALDRAIAEAVAGRIGSLILTDASGETRTARLIPLPADHALRSGARNVAVLIVQNNRVDEDDCAMLATVFGLTERESAVALRIAWGESLKMVADQLGVTIATVRVHLRAIFWKTGTRRQAELTALIFRKFGRM